MVTGWLQVVTNQFTDQTDQTKEADTVQDVQNREVMAALYRIIETYETPPDCDTDEQIMAYFDKVRADIQEFYSKYWDKEHNYFARELSHGLYSAISNRFREHHEHREHRDKPTGGGVYQ